MAKYKYICRECKIRATEEIEDGYKRLDVRCEICHNLMVPVGPTDFVTAQEIYTAYLEEQS